MAGKYWFANNPKGRVLAGSVTFDPGNLASDEEDASTTVTVTGAALGDMAFCSFSLDNDDVVMSCSVTAANTVTVNYKNTSGGAKNLGSGTLRVLVIPSAAIDDIIADM